MPLEYISINTYSSKARDSQKCFYRLQDDAPRPSLLWNDEIEFDTNSICGAHTETKHNVNSPECNCIVGAPTALHSINYILDKLEFKISP